MWRIYKISCVLLNNRQLFCDFGENFLVRDTDGDPPKVFMIAHISKVKSWYSYFFYSDAAIFEQNIFEALRHPDF